jgi:hypothetical protein
MKNMKGKQIANSVNVKKTRPEYQSVTVGLSKVKAPEYRKVDAQVIVDKKPEYQSVTVKLAKDSRKERRVVGRIKGKRPKRNR